MTQNNHFSPPSPLQSTSSQPRGSEDESNASDSPAVVSEPKEQQYDKTIPCISPIGHPDETLTHLKSVIEDDDEWDSLEGFLHEKTDCFHKTAIDDDDDDERIVKSFVSSSEKTRSLRIMLFDDDELISDEQSKSAQIPDFSNTDKTDPNAKNLFTEDSPDNAQSSRKEAQIIKHFEGTNEIFINSRVFAAICEDDKGPLPGAKSKTEPRTTSDIGSKSLSISAPKLHPTRCDDSNIFGIVSSGILPNVDIDKSFDTPCIDEETLSSSEEPEQGEVFVSKLSPAQSKEAVQFNKSSNILQGNSGFPQNPASVQTSFGLPLPTNARELHPDDKSEQAPAESFCRFAIGHFYDTRYTELNNIDVGDIGLTEDLERLFDCTEGIYVANSPKLIYVRSRFPFERNRLVHAFMTRCSQGLPNCHCYTSALNGNPHLQDLVTALISSRIGCFPDSPEEERMSCILKGAEELFDHSDVMWGRDILLIRYLLPQYVSAKKELPILTSRNKIDLLEALLGMIAHDAKSGPVIIAISDEWIRHGHIWRDVVRHIQTMECSNILILVATTPDVDVLNEAGTFDVSPYQYQEVRAILEAALQEYTIPPQVLDEFAQNTGGSFADIRHALKIIVRALGTQNCAISGSILPSQPAEKAYAFFNAFTPEETRFLCVASLLHEHFYFDDLVKVFYLEPLPEEIVWFQERRREWCSNIAAKLVNHGELIPVQESETAPGNCYIIPEREVFRDFINATDPAMAAKIRGMYAKVLEQRNAGAMQQAIAFEQTGLWDKSAHAWLSIAQQLINNFYNQSANSILKHCLPHIGPEHAVVYKVLLMQCIHQNMRLGRFEQVCIHADVLARYGFIINDVIASCLAFIEKGNALRIMGRYSEAKEILQYAIQLAENLKNEARLADANHAMAQLTYDAGGKGALANALRYAEKALETRRKKGDLTKLAETQTLCASIYQLRGESERAEQAANEAFRALNASGHWFDTPYPLMLIAESATALGKPLPFDSLDRGFEIANKTGDITQQFNLLLVRVKLQINSLQRQAVRDDFDAMKQIITKWPLLPWITQYQLLLATFDFSRKNFQKTTKSLKTFFDTATKLGNSYLLSVGYALSAELNFEVYKRNLGTISLEKTNKLYRTATNIYESLGAWHKVAETLLKYADFLDYTNQKDEAEKARRRASKVAPCQ